jgi:rhamnose transport system permease protein
VPGCPARQVGLPAIVVTLGTLTIFRGSAFVLSGGEWVNTFQMSHAYLDLPRRMLFGLPLLAWAAVAVIALAALLFTRTAAGRALYAVGGNPAAAVYVGIDAGRTVFSAFCFSGLLAGLCGYLWVSRFAVAYVDIAAGFELDVIAACVIGGVSISGGLGSVGGAVLGALFLGIIKNALPVVGISPFWQMSISGAIIIAAVILNTRAERTKGRIILRHLAAGQETGA